MLRMHLVGGLVVEVDGRAVAVPQSWRVRSLLAWLALNPGEHRRAELASRFWPEILDTSARASLRTALWSVRKLLGPDAAEYLIATRETVGLAADPQIWVDVAEFAKLVESGRLVEALEFGRGELLAGLDEEWVYEPRDEHRERVATVLGRLADSSEAEGDLTRAILLTREQVVLDRFSEPSAQELMRRLDLSGDPAAALAAYERLANGLRAELGLAPSAETRELAARVRSNRAGTDPATRSPGAALPLPALLVQARGAPFVGREAELAKLERHWQRAQAGEREVVIIAGEPGIGKTRLVGELARWLAAAGSTVLYGRSYQETLTPYQPFVEALRHYVGACDPDVLRWQLGENVGELGALVPELSERLPGLAEASERDPEGRRYRLFEAVARLLREASRPEPLVLILDDLHWADRSSLLLLEHVLRHPAPPLPFVVATYRDAGFTPDHPLAHTLAELRRDVELERLRLPGLGERDVHALAAPWVGGATDPGFAAALRRRTGGNPFFMHELLRQLDSTGGPQREGGVVPGSAIERLVVPEGVREAIGRRLWSLSEETARVLATAAVVGTEFSAEIIERACDLEGEGLVDALEEAVNEQLISETQGPGARYEFTHALIREAIYKNLASARRVRLHLHVGETLEAARAAGGQVDLSELAHHFFEAASAGHHLNKAVDYAVAAAEIAGGQLAYEKAAEHYQRAADALATGDPDPGRRCDLLLGLGESLWSAGQFARSRAAFRDAAEIAEAAGVVDELARAALGFGGRTGFEIVVANPPLVVLLERALDRLGPADSALRARVAVRLGEALMFSPSRPRAEALAVEAVEMARRLDDDAVLAEVLNNANWILWNPDNLAERLERAREIIALADQSGATRLQIEGRIWLGSGLLEHGDRAAAEREFDVCAALAQDVRQPYHLWGTEVIEAMRAMFSQPLHDVDEMVWSALETGQTGQIPAAAHLFGTQIFHVRLLQGRPAEMRSASEAYADAFPGVPALRCGLALVYCELGQAQAARRELETIAGDDFGAVPRDFVWLSAMDLLSGVCAYLGDEARAATLYELLRPYADRFVIASAFAVPRGSVSRLLGVLAATQSRLDEAEVHFEVALERDATGPVAPLVESRHGLARTLLARGEPGDRDRALGLIAEALEAAERAGLQQLVERSHALRREARSEPAGQGPGRRTFAQLAQQASGDARATLSTRGRAALARLTGDASDEGLERSFGSRLAQRALMTAMTRSFQPRLALGFVGEVQLELIRGGSGGDVGSDWWAIEVSAKRASARRRIAVSPAVTMQLRIPDFVRIFSGLENPILAWVEGRLRVEGDVLLAARLIEMFGGVNPSEVLERIETR